MSNLNSYTDCSGCDVYTLPPAPVCVERPRLSQIIRLVVLPNAAQLPLDWTVGTDWNSVINNSNSTVAFGRILHGKGGVSDPAEAVVQLGRIDRKITRRRYTMDFEMTITETTRPLLRKMQKGVLDFRFWFFTQGNVLFGGAGGIIPLVVSAVMPLGAGANDFELGRIRIEFASDIDTAASVVPDFVDVDLYSGYLIDDNGDFLDDDNNDFLET